MRIHVTTNLLLALGLAFLCLGQGLWAQSANVSVFASGFNNPRGLEFGPDGNLYVAEGGAGGTLSSAGVCDQVVAPVGPYTGDFTARISKSRRTELLLPLRMGCPPARLHQT